MVQLEIGKVLGGSLLCSKCLLSFLCSLHINVEGGSRDERQSLLVQQQRCVPIMRLNSRLFLCFHLGILSFPCASGRRGNLVFPRRIKSTVSLPIDVFNVLRVKDLASDAKSFRFLSSNPSIGYLRRLSSFSLALTVLSQSSVISSSSFNPSAPLTRLITPFLAWETQRLAEPCPLEQARGPQPGSRSGLQRGPDCGARGRDSGYPGADPGGT
jgi:hypothetical protein